MTRNDALDIAWELREQLGASPYDLAPKYPDWVDAELGPLLRAHYGFAQRLSRIEFDAEVFLGRYRDACRGS